jgi:hypothetical protein
MKIHAIIIALNEEDFIYENLHTIYPFVTGISVITQYDRDYFGNKVDPDSTVSKVLNFPDLDGKIHLISRKYNDETAQRNHEMNAVMFDASKGINSHRNAIDEVAEFHAKPDYFWIIDADEIYDIETIPRILEYLKKKRPRGMRVSAYEYGFDWNHRVPPQVYIHHHFGFIKSGIMFKERRVVTWNEHRIKYIFKSLGFNQNYASWLFGFIDCPMSIGMFHHAAYIRKDKEAMMAKMKKHSHPENHHPSYLENILKQNYEFVHKKCLPRNIVEGNWPHSFWSTHT